MVEFDSLFFKKVVDFSSESILITDSSGVIIFMNAKAEETFLYKNEELIGEKVEILIQKELRDSHQKSRKEFESTMKERPHGKGLDVYALRKNGESFPVEVSLKIIEEAGKKYVISIVSDISFRKEKEKKIQRFISENNRLVSLQSNLQFEVLKNQISPHFLFNSLSVLYSIIDSSKNNSKLFVQKLSNLYGYVLESRLNKSVSVKEEISFIKDYFFVQGIRFENKFQVEIDEVLMNDKHHYLIPLSLQLLIENIFKHNKLSDSESLKIRLVEEGKGIMIKNNLTGTKYTEKSYGIGISNLVEQYKLLSKKSLKVTKGKKEFKVWIPFIE